MKRRGRRLGKCFHRCQMGALHSWKDKTPKQLVDEKRELDGLLYINGALFSPELKDAWDGFRTAAFKELNGIGEDALLRTKPSYHSMVKSWNANWNKAFTGEDNQHSIGDTYKTLVQVFTKNISPKLGFAWVPPDECASIHPE